MQRKMYMAIAVITVMATSLASFGFVKASSPPPADVLITAVQITGGVGRANDDFIELYNTTSIPLNLNGFRLVKRTATALSDTLIKSWTTDIYIPPHSFYLWANSGYASISPVPDLSTSATLSDNNGIAIRLGANDTGQIIDSLAWGSANNSFVNSGLVNPIVGQSIIRATYDFSSGYMITVSSPRNSSIQTTPILDPPQVDPGPVTPPLVTDDAVCSILNSINITQPNTLLPVSLKFTNTGTSIWDSAYSVKSSEGLVVQVNSDWTAQIDIISPPGDGQYSYQWQMVKNDQLFGSPCVLSFAVQSQNLNPSVVDPPVSDPVILEPPQVDTPPVEPIVESEPLADPVVSVDPVQEVVPDSLISPSTIKITEIIPNPIGVDSGREVVELYNYGQEVVNLDNWSIDAVEGSVGPTSKSVTLANLNINPGQYLSIPIPLGKFSLGNTKGGYVTIFSFDDKIIDSVKYTGKAPSGQSYSLINNDWKWVEPTFGLENEDKNTSLVPQTDLNTNQIIANDKKEVVKEGKSLKTKNPLTVKVKKAVKTLTSKASSVKKTVTKKIKSSSTKGVAKKESSKKGGAVKPINNELKSKPADKTDQSDKPKNPAGVLALAIASLSAGGLAIYRYGISGLF